MIGLQRRTEVGEWKAPRLSTVTKTGLAVLALSLLSGCGGGADGDPAASTTIAPTTATTAPETTTTSTTLPLETTTTEQEAPSIGDFEAVAAPDQAALVGIGELTCHPGFTEEVFIDGGTGHVYVHNLYYGSYYNLTKDYVGEDWDFLDPYFQTKPQPGPTGIRFSEDILDIVRSDFDGRLSADGTVIRPDDLLQAITHPWCG